MDEDTTPKRPSFGAFQVKDGPEGQSYFNRIGSAFAHKDGQGHTVQLDAVPVDGRVILRTPQERVADTRSKGTRRSRREEIER
jgi:RNase P/RNase MRP subunit p29